MEEYKMKSSEAKKYFHYYPLTFKKDSSESKLEIMKINFLKIELNDFKECWNSNLLKDALEKYLWISFTSAID